MEQNKVREVSLSFISRLNFFAQQPQISATVSNRQNFNHIAENMVNEQIVAIYQLPEFAGHIVTEYLSQKRMLAQEICLVEGPGHEFLGPRLSIFRYCRRNFEKFVQCGASPRDMRHSSNLRFASSCEITSPALDAARPFSISLSTYTLYMISSKVLSGGISAKALWTSAIAFITAIYVNDSKKSKKIGLTSRTSTPLPKRETEDGHRGRRARSLSGVEMTIGKLDHA